MRVITWNCRNATAKSRVWDYLLELAPDVALLQEVRGLPQHVMNDYAAIQHYPVCKDGVPQRFTTAVLVRGSIGDPIPLTSSFPSVNAELQHFVGNLVGVELKPDRGPRIKAVCVYSPAWPVDRGRLSGVDVTGVRLKQSRDVWVADLLWAALASDKPQPDAYWVIGGDFNLCETFDFWRGGAEGESRIPGSYEQTRPDGLPSAYERVPHSNLPDGPQRHGDGADRLPVCDGRPTRELNHVWHGPPLAGV